MRHPGWITRILLAVFIGGLLLMAGLIGAKPASAGRDIPIPAQATEELAPAIVLPTLTPLPVKGPWAGDPRNPNYDGRLRATMADRYAVYCKDGEFQVWDSVENRKVAGIPLNRVTNMLSASILEAGAGVFLGRSDNVLTVVGPGDFTKDGLDFAACAASSE